MGFQCFTRVGGAPVVEIRLPFDCGDEIEETQALTG